MLWHFYLRQYWWIVWPIQSRNLVIQFVSEVDRTYPSSSNRSWHTWDMPHEVNRPRHHPSILNLPGTDQIHIVDIHPVMHNIYRSHYNIPNEYYYQIPILLWYPRERKCRVIANLSHRSKYSKCFPRIEFKKIYLGRKTHSRHKLSFALIDCRRTVAILLSVVAIEGTFQFALTSSSGCHKNHRVSTHILIAAYCYEMQ